MKAYVYSANGAVIAEAPKPTPQGVQVLVRVHACGLNRADLGMTKGHVHGAAGGVGTVLGMEWAGEVAALGPDAQGVKIGDRVMGSGAAALAQYTLADHGRLFQIPGGMSFEDAATLPVALTTMHNALVTNGQLQVGQSVLIQGASSGVGLMALQIAKLKGAKLVVGSSTDRGRRDRLKDFGADLTIDSSDPGWVDQVLKATDGQGVDLVDGSLHAAGHRKDDIQRDRPFTPAIDLRNGPDHDAGVQHMVVEREIVARDRRDSEGVLARPVRGTQAGGHVEQCFRAGLAGPVAFKRCFQFTPRTDPWRTQRADGDRCRKR